MLPIRSGGNQLKTLADYRRDAGYKTQQELIPSLGVRRSALSRWETGSRYPRTPMITKLALLLGVTEGEIIDAISAAKKAGSDP